jgi:hypothetical protein
MTLPTKQVKPEWVAHKLFFPKRDYSALKPLAVAAAVALLICLLN